MNLLNHTKVVIDKHILSRVRLKHFEMFKFGICAFTLRKYDSLGSNARQVVANENTASSKVWRLTKNANIIPTFHKLVKLSGLVKTNSLVNIDFSTFCGFQTLAFAVQTKLGRSIPVWLDCITYPITYAGSQNLFILENIKSLGKILGFYPRLVFDRGFVIPTLIEFMLKANITFYIRIKAGHSFEWNDKKRKYKAKKIGEYTKDTTISGYNTTLRLIVSPPPPKKKRGQ